jgi:hypothetical protein
VSRWPPQRENLRFGAGDLLSADSARTCAARAAPSFIGGQKGPTERACLL